MAMSKVEFNQAGSFWSGKLTIKFIYVEFYILSSCDMHIVPLDFEQIADLDCTYFSNEQSGLLLTSELMEHSFLCTIVSKTFGLFLTKKKENLKT